MDLVADCYTLTRALPHDEDFVLKLQIRRASVSIPSNIAEGHGRTGVPEYLHHLSIAHGSLIELETQLLLTVRLEYLRQEQISSVLSATEEISRMLKGLMRRLRERTKDPNMT
jgi:four helix bundle protein